MPATFPTLYIIAGGSNDAAKTTLRLDFFHPHHLRLLCRFANANFCLPYDLFCRSSDDDFGEKPSMV